MAYRFALRYETVGRVAYASTLGRERSEEGVSEAAVGVARYDASAQVHRLRSKTGKPTLRS